MRRLFELLVGAGLVVAMAYMIAENVRYARHGLVAYGTVVTVTNHVEVHEGSFSHTQSPVVEYLPQGSREKRRFREAGWTASFLTPKTGSRVRVLYLANEPENARMAGLRHWLIPLLLGALGVAALLGKLHWSDRDDGGWRFRWDD